MKTTTASSDPHSFAKLQSLVESIDVAMVTTVTPDGTLRSRPMVTREFNDDGELWFFTADDSEKAGDLAAEHGVNVSYADPKEHRYVSVSGNAAIMHDAEKATELWHPMVKPYFPRGLEDPHLALLRVRIETAEFWDAATSKMVQLFQFGKAGKTNGAGPGEHTKVEIRATPSSG